MKKIVLRFGLASGVVLAVVSSVSITLCMRGNLDFSNSEIVGYTAMVLSFLMVFFGIRSYRDNVAAGSIGFGKAFQVGILITLITCAIYVVSWEIAYFNFFPHFLDQYTAHVLLKMRSTGASEAAIQEQAASFKGQQFLRNEGLGQPRVALEHHRDPRGLHENARTQEGSTATPARARTLRATASRPSSRAPFIAFSRCGRSRISQVSGPSASSRICGNSCATASSSCVLGVTR